MNSSNKEIHPSDSTPQKDAEAEMRIFLQKKFGCDLNPETIRNTVGDSLEIDGYSKQARILCEIYAHIGSLKGSQPDKPLADAVKMLLAEKWLGGNWRKVFAFADATSARSFQSGSWRADAMKHLGIEIIVVQLNANSADSITKAQRKQKMTNAPA
jgi:hypothetical protein